MNEIIEKIRNIQFQDGEADYQAMYEIVDNMHDINDRLAFIPYLFEFFETNADKDVGTPGPFVHFIEEKPDYHKLLKASINKKPTYITLWMANRILNKLKIETEIKSWLDILSNIISNPATNNSVKEMAKEFLQYQENKIT